MDGEDPAAWIEEVAVPALAGTPLFAGCPEQFLVELARLVEATDFEPDEAVTTVGDAVASMHVVLKGSFDLESKSGVKVGILGVGGVLGEAQLLGTFEMRTVTAIALEHSTVLTVTSRALQRALRQPEGRAISGGLSRLLAQRREQVDLGLPMSLLPSVRVAPGDLTARLVALQAERLTVMPGDLWQLLPDTDPNGPRLGILVRGKAVLELSDDCKDDVQLRAPLVLAEGLPENYGARIRMVSADSEVYRLRLIDILAAAHTLQQPPEWFYQLRILEKDSRSKLQGRLVNAKGLAKSRAPHPTDAGIREWKMRREKSIKKAERIRELLAQRLGDGMVLKLPPLEQKIKAQVVPVMPVRKPGTPGFQKVNSEPILRRRLIEAL